MRVLLAEDDAMLASVIVEALGDEGHTVTHVSRSADAQRLAAAERWDVLVVDAFGGGYDQPDQAEREQLRSLAAHGPVVLASGRAWVQHMAPAELGVAAIVPKPYDLGDLLDTLAALDRSAPRSQDAG